MIDHGRVRSTVCPQPMVTDELSVWKHTNITPVTENEGTDMEFVGYELKMSTSWRKRRKTPLCRIGSRPQRSS